MRSVKVSCFVMSFKSPEVPSCVFVLIVWLLAVFILTKSSFLLYFFPVCVTAPSAKASEEDQERTRRLADAEMHRHHLESLLDQRDREITALREVRPYWIILTLKGTLAISTFYV